MKTQPRMSALRRVVGNDGYGLFMINYERIFFWNHQINLKNNKIYEL
jgi:hypothetical protein